MWSSSTGPFLALPAPLIERWACQAIGRSHLYRTCAVLRPPRRSDASRRFAPEGGEECLPRLLILGALKRRRDPRIDGVKCGVERAHEYIHGPLVKWLRPSNGAPRR